MKVDKFNNFLNSAFMKKVSEGYYNGNKKAYKEFIKKYNDFDYYCENFHFDLKKDYETLKRYYQKDFGLFVKEGIAHIGLSQKEFSRRQFNGFKLDLYKELEKTNYIIYSNSLDEDIEKAIYIGGTREEIAIKAFEFYHNIKG